MSDDLYNVPIENGKYKFVVTKEGKCYILLHDEMWIDEPKGSSMLIAACGELETLRTKVKELEESVGVLAAEAWAGHELHCSGVSMERKDNTRRFRWWHDAMDNRKKNKLAQEAYEKARAAKP